MTESGTGSGCGTGWSAAWPVLDPGREMPAVEADGGRYIGVLELPSLGLALPVM